MTIQNTLFLVTGTTQGLGKYIFSVLKEITENIITVNRSPFNYADNIQFDFDNIEKIEGDLFLKLKERISQAENIIVILNAGIIDPIMEVGNYQSTEIFKIVNVNITSQILFTNFIVKQNKKGIIVNISSGSAHNANKGLGLYSLSKSAMHRFFEISEIENTMMSFLNFDPGNMDTQMHEKLRSEDNEFELRYKQQLKDQYKNGEMKTPQKSANRLISKLTHLMEDI